MSKVVTVEYDAAEKVLRLDEELEGVANHTRMNVTIDPPAADQDERPWMKLSGSLSQEAGEELAAIIDEMFPIER